ncbi:hypothetical protein HanRHA438_Chr00c03g0844541 [Helianthus annuus]|nr:hypothetical protein HanRHA438_Chr00c03g0844541 [Helianthus annuus]
MYLFNLRITYICVGDIKTENFPYFVLNSSIRNNKYYICNNFIYFLGFRVKKWMIHFCLACLLNIINESYLGHVSVDEGYNFSLFSPKLSSRLYVYFSHFSFTQFQIFTNPKSELFICFSFLCNLIPYSPTASSQSSQTLFIFERSVEDNDGGV